MSLEKIKFALLVLLRDYSNSFNNVAELSTNRMGGNGVQVETEKGKFTVVMVTLYTRP